MAPPGRVTVEVAAAAACFFCFFFFCFSFFSSVSSEPYSLLDSNVTDHQHNISLGYRWMVNNYTYNDFLVFDDVVRESAFRLLNLTQNQTHCYPWGFTEHKKYVITALNVTDLEPRGEGGYVSVLSGGVGWHNVCLFFTTQPGKSFRFKVEGWGYKV